MPYPTAVVADAVTYKNSAGVTVPALAASADGGSGAISLFVDDPAGAYFVHVVPKDLTGARYNSWNWPSGAVGSLSVTAFGSSPAAAGASVSGNALTLQPADGSHPGGVSLSAQTMGAGDKTFPGNVFTPVLCAGSSTLFTVGSSGDNITINAPTTGGALVRSSQSGAHFAYISAAGVEVDVVGQSFILKSADGTRWKLSVANTTGALTAVLA